MLLLLNFHLPDLNIISEASLDSLSTPKAISPLVLGNAFVTSVPGNVMSNITVRTKVKFKLVSQGREEQASAVPGRHNSLVFSYIYFILSSINGQPWLNHWLKPEGGWWPHRWWLVVDAFIRCLLRTNRSGAFEPAYAEPSKPIVSISINITLIAWKRSWREYLYHRNWKAQQMNLPQSVVKTRCCIFTRTLLGTRSTVMS